MPLNLQKGRAQRRPRQQLPSVAKIAGMRALLYIFLAGCTVALVISASEQRLDGLLTAVAVLAAVMWAKLLFERNLRQRLEIGLQVRLQSLIQRLLAPDQSLSVKENGGWLGPAAATLVGIVLWEKLAATASDGKVIAGGVLILAAILWLRRLRRLGQPVLVVSRAGFSTPSEGFTPWQRVRHISLGEVDARGLRLHHRLELTVDGRNAPPAGSTSVQRMWRQLRLALRGEVVRIPLQFPSEDPQMLAALTDILRRNVRRNEGLDEVEQRRRFEEVFAGAIHGQASARADVRPALTHEEHAELVSRARAEPLDLDFSAPDPKDSR